MPRAETGPQHGVCMPDAGSRREPGPALGSGRVARVRRGHLAGRGGTSAYLSKVAARMYLPFGENFTKDTGGLSSSAWKQGG